MTLLALGINHKTAPVTLRERVAFSQESLDQALDSLLAQPLVQGGCPVYLQPDRIVLKCGAAGKFAGAAGAMAVRLSPAEC